MGRHKAIAALCLSSLFKRVQTRTRYAGRRRLAVESVRRVQWRQLQLALSLYPFIIRTRGRRSHVNTLNYRLKNISFYASVKKSLLGSSWPMLLLLNGVADSRDEHLGLRSQNFALSSNMYDNCPGLFHPNTRAKISSDIKPLFAQFCAQP